MKKVEIIGMVNLPTLPGYPQHKGMEYVMETAMRDADGLIAGGIDEILIENTDDDPHVKYIGPETVSALTLIASSIIKKTEKPVGICALWNDYKAAIAIAKCTGGRFVRIPVFTETRRSASGIIEGNPYDVISYRSKIGAENIKIYADIHCKHSAPIAERPIDIEAREALHFGADGLIITGRYTGDAPLIDDIKRVRDACPAAFLLAGSGVTFENISGFSDYIDAAIVGTYLRTEGVVDEKKVRRLRDVIKGDVKRMGGEKNENRN